MKRVVLALLVFLVGCGEDVVEPPPIDVTGRWRTWEQISWEPFFGDWERHWEFELDLVQAGSAITGTGRAERRRPALWFYDVRIGDGLWRAATNDIRFDINGNWRQSGEPWSFEVVGTMNATGTEFLATVAPSMDYLWNQDSIRFVRVPGG